jgi:hypothetical protein
MIAKCRHATRRQSRLTWCTEVIAVSAVVTDTAVDIVDHGVRTLTASKSTIYFTGSIVKFRAGSGRAGGRVQFGANRHLA